MSIEIGFRLARVDPDPQLPTYPPEEIWRVLGEAGIDLRVKWLVLPATTVEPPGHLEAFVLATPRSGGEMAGTERELRSLLAVAAPGHRLEPLRRAADQAFAREPFEPAWTLVLDPSAGAARPRTIGFGREGAEPGEGPFDAAAMNLERTLVLAVTADSPTVLEWRLRPGDATRPADVRMEVLWSGATGPAPALLGLALARTLGAPDGSFVARPAGGSRTAPAALELTARGADLALPLPPVHATRRLVPSLAPVFHPRPPCIELPGEGTPLGHTSDGRPVRLSLADRLRHEWIVGQTGTGKSTLMLNQILADLEDGHGLAVFDPHGELVAAVRDRMPASRRDDVIFVDARQTGDDVPVLNVLECDDVETAHARAGQILEMIVGLWPREMCGPVFQQAATNALVTLAARFEDPGTLADLPRLFLEERFRRSFLESFPARDRIPEAVTWWTSSYENYTAQTRSEALDYYISKFGLFFTDPLLRRVLGRPRSTIDLRRIMDQRGVLLCNLSRGSANPLAATLLTWVFFQATLNAALSREHLPRAERRPFFLFCDEFQRLVGPSTAAFLSEVRKFGLGLVLAHQFVDQLPEATLAAVLGNVGTKVLFRLGPRDAQRMTSFAPDLSTEELVRLPNYHAWLELLVDGVPTPPFTMRGLPPPRAQAPD